MRLWNGYDSAKRMLLLGAVVVIVYATALATSWIASLFPAARDGVLVGVHRTRIVTGVEIREVEKWRERTVPCVDLVELLPKDAPASGFLPRDSAEVAELTRALRKAEKERADLEKAFRNTIDLGKEHLLRTLDVGGSRWGWKIAGTIPKEPELDQGGQPLPRRLKLTAAEKDAPLLGAGKRSEWWLGVGGLYRDRALQTPAFGLGISTEAFTVKKMIGTVRLFGGVDQNGEPVALGFFAVGGERWRARTREGD